MTKAMVAITSIVCATILMVVAVAMGYDATLVTGSVAAIIAAGSGFTFYYKGRTKEAEKQTEVTNGAMDELAKALYQLFEANIEGNDVKKKTKG